MESISYRNQIFTYGLCENYFNYLISICLYTLIVLNFFYILDIFFSDVSVTIVLSVLFYNFFCYWIPSNIVLCSLQYRFPKFSINNYF